MMYKLCRDCDYCKTDRKNEQGQVRCTRFSQWVNSNDKSCNEFFKGDCGCFFDGKVYREGH